MITNNERRELLNRVKSSGYPGGISEVFQAASQGVDLIEQFQLSQNSEAPLTASTPEEQETGLREEHAQGNTNASMVFPNVAANTSFNTNGMKVPINIDKVDDMGNLVKSYKNVPPGIQDLPTGPAEGTIIESPAAYQKGGVRKRGYIQKYQTAGFDMSGFNMEPITSVQDNVLTPQVLQVQNENKDFNKKNALLTKIAKDKKIAENEAAMKAMKGTLVDTTKRNAATLLSNTLLTNQLAGGYGGINMRKSIEANPDKIDEIYKNTMSSSGQNTMKWIGLGVATGGLGSTNLGGATNYLKHMGSGINTMRSSSGIGSGLNTAFQARPFLKGAFQTGYNALKLGALPAFYNQTGNFGVDLATGNYDNLQKRTMDFGRGVVSVSPALRKIKDAYKIGQDAYEGNYADVLTRSIALGSRSPGIGKGLEYYGTKFGGKFLPESWQNLGGLPSIKSMVNKYTRSNNLVDKIKLSKTD